MVYIRYLPRIHLGAGAPGDQPVGYATVEGSGAKISERVAPLVAVPTTAGTGSEFKRSAIRIVDDERKLGFHNRQLVPKAALLDPELAMERGHNRAHAARRAATLLPEEPPRAPFHWLACSTGRADRLADSLRHCTATCAGTA